MHPSPRMLGWCAAARRRPSRRTITPSRRGGDMSRPARCLDAPLASAPVQAPRDGASRRLSGGSVVLGTAAGGGPPFTKAFDCSCFPKAPFLSVYEPDRPVTDVGIYSHDRCHPKKSENPRSRPFLCLRRPLFGSPKHPSPTSASTPMIGGPPKSQKTQTSASLTGSRPWRGSPDGP